ncbi:hypothetical protein ACHAQH_006599 [Verticillium albo-atrum]
MVAIRSILLLLTLGALAEASKKRHKPPSIHPDYAYPPVPAAVAPPPPIMPPAPSQMHGPGPAINIANPISIPQVTTTNNGGPGGAPPLNVAPVYHAPVYHAPAAAAPAQVPFPVHIPLPMPQYDHYQAPPPPPAAPYHPPVVYQPPPVAHHQPVAMPASASQQQPAMMMPAGLLARDTNGHAAPMVPGRHRRLQVMEVERLTAAAKPKIVG